MISRKSEMSPGNTYVVTVDRISGSGNGIVSLSEGHINLGSMDKRRVGDKVRIRYFRDGDIEIADNVVSPGTDYDSLKEDPTENRNDLLNGHQ